MAESHKTSSSAQNPVESRRQVHQEIPWDLIAAAGAMSLIAALSAVNTGAFDWLAFLVLAVVPGYVLLQVIRPAARLWHVAAGVGFSIPIVGLLALLTAFFPGGFTTTAIVATVTIGVLSLTGLAWGKRTLAAHDLTTTA